MTMAMEHGKLDASSRGQIQTGTYLGLAGAILGGLLLVAFLLLVVGGVTTGIIDQRVRP